MPPKNNFKKIQLRLLKMSHNQHADKHLNLIACPPLVTSLT